MPSPRLLIGSGVALALVTVAVTAFVLKRPPAVAQPPAAPAPAATATPPPAATPTPGPPAAGSGLAIGVTEFNPNLVASPADRALPEPWNRWRDALGAIRPAFYRLVIDWAAIQPSPDVPANLDAPQAGCVRATGPCLPWVGVRDQLKALASRQREGGWQALVVITGTPAWAAAPASGCERPSAGPSARPPRADALGAYRQLVSALQAAAVQAGADLRYWSAWNEPNHPAFVSPQRAACDPASPSLAPAAYADLARTLQTTLTGDQQLVLGETAGLLKPTRYVTSVPEFIAGLPQDVVCASTVWTQHAYIGGDDPVPAVTQALAARGCPHPFTIWITETGVGPAPEDLSAAQSIADDQAGCRALHERLVTWFDDPQVTVAIQYTFRQDDRFPTGLVSTDLTAPRAALAEWTAWGARPSPSAPPPPAVC